MNTTPTTRAAALALPPDAPASGEDALRQQMVEMRDALMYAAGEYPSSAYSSDHAERAANIRKRAAAALAKVRS